MAEVDKLEEDDDPVWGAFGIGSAPAPAGGRGFPIWLWIRLWSRRA